MLTTFLENQAAFWIAAGFLLLAVEALAFGFSSGLLLFGSLGAILTGALLWLSIVPDNFIAAVACFAISTAAVTGLLWSPLKRFQSGTELGNDRSSDIIGHTFILGSDVSRTAPGVQKYSGINWRVEPSDVAKQDTLPQGTPVQVDAVSVGVFYVSAQARD